MSEQMRTSPECYIEGMDFLGSETEAVTSILQLKHTKELTDAQRRIYERWERLRENFEIELTEIQRALSGDSIQIEASAEGIHLSAERLSELVPELKQIAQSLEDQEWKTTMERIPR